MESNLVRRPPARRLILAVCGAVLALAPTGCLVIGGRSGRGGLFFWPGGIGGLVLVLFVVALLRRR